MGLPDIHFSFENKKNNAVRRLGRGIVAYVDIAEGNTPASMVKLDDVADIKTNSISDPTMVAQLTRMFEYGCKKILLVKATDFTSAEPFLKRERYNYLALTATQAQEAITWAKACNFKAGRNFILIADGASALAAKSDKVVCTYPYMSTGIKLGTPMDLAAICAGNNDKRSATYYVLAQDNSLTDEELNKYPDRPTADTETDKGQVVMFDDGVKVKVGRAVTTLYADHAEKQDKNPFYKIRLVDSMNTIQDDIQDVFDNDYIGQEVNSPENKASFLALLNAVYLKGLEGELLAKGAVNELRIDIEAHKELAKAEGKDVSTMSEIDLRNYDTGDALYLEGDLTLADTWEDLHVKFYV